MKENMKLIQELESIIHIIAEQDEIVDLDDLVKQYANKELIADTIAGLHLLKLAFLKLDLIKNLEEDIGNSREVDLAYKRYQKECIDHPEALNNWYFNLHRP